MFDGISVTIFFYALLGGVIPTIIWLSFWLREDSTKDPEPPFLLMLTFIGGMLVVPLVIPIENVVYNSLFSSELALGINAFIEEFGKFIVVALIAFGTQFVDEPRDYALYLITGGLGFAALENTLFLLETISAQNIAITFYTGNLRFLGATVLHAIASAFVGVSLGLAFYKSTPMKYLYGGMGLLVATVVHGLFNYFILRATFENILTIFGFVWFAAVIILFLFEKLKQMKYYRGTV
ncbi:MAG: PrsW family intramembrane metalloprotease [Candidatus Pacebacteria bacterium]|nr:PrsW family intramembrane metalloprotease [Candidatus Paceibacterota bacterium]MCD8507901.1 PrsW family intramembrane metalloprotease [Candidatus Paceibacterota bacterium]MCD8527895.1 PrsW family intramembrane metalloprotease [Candidatus Paceibacterota bacterium]MCD8563553.1 PrsW family intramembrane metalloprotease [Candidatus Paceibacterota bacterium]